MRSKMLRLYKLLFFLWLCCGSVVMTSCTESQSKQVGQKDRTQHAAEGNLSETKVVKDSKTSLDTVWRNLPDSALVEVLLVDSSFIIDIRYATTNNFMKMKVYPCDKCLLRKTAAISLKKAHDLFKKEGYKIKIYDGYRPLSVQWELWNRTTNKNYVANPKKGSNHNRGCAVDMTLTDMNGKELDMGTPYDFFGPAAHHTYTNLPAKVLKNRLKLKNIMESVGFKSISNEWWHYDYKIKYSVLDQPLPCDPQKN